MRGDARGCEWMRGKWQPTFEPPSKGPPYQIFAEFQAEKIFLKKHKGPPLSKFFGVPNLTDLELSS